MKINVGGLEAGVYVLRRLNAPAALLPKIRYSKPKRPSVLSSEKLN